MVEKESIDLLQALIHNVPDGRTLSLAGIETARVYFPFAADRATVEALIAARLPLAASIEFIPAWICRAELLVEIEATIAPDPS